MEESGIGRGDTIMVGDSAVDIMTARNAASASLRRQLGKFSARDIPQPPRRRIL